LKQNTMMDSMKQLDGLLRGEVTRISALRNGTVEVSASRLAMVIQILGLLYGLCMGCYALFRTGGPSDLTLAQLLSTTIKVPALIFLTLLVTFPSLYVFNALIGSRLTLVSVLRLLIAAVAVMMTVLASFGPIVAFFSASTTSYPFMLLLNVVVFTVSGFLGLRFLLFTLHRLSVAVAETQPQRPLPVVPHAVDPESIRPADPLPIPPPLAAPRKPGALDRVHDQAFGGDVKTIFRIWIVVFGLVGAQMSWVLRPFIGSPDADFAFLRARESNFFEAVWTAIMHL